MANTELDIRNDADVKRAVAFAEKAHAGQVRKKDGVTPYVTHAKDVMDMLISCMDYEFLHFCRNLTIKGSGKTAAKQMREKNPLAYEVFYDSYKQLVMAGVLHDVVEDTNMCVGLENGKLSREEKMKILSENFSQEVCDVVDVMTEWKQDDYDDRKNTQQKRILDASRGAKLVKCADNISNLGETVADCKAGNLEAWKIYKIRPTQVVENHINTLGALEELEGNPLKRQFNQIVKDSIDLAVECEARLGTQFWDEKAAKVNKQVTDENVEKYFRETYKSNMREINR